MAKGKKQYPHYRLEEPHTGLGVAQSTAGYLPVKLAAADTFTDKTAALIASAGAGIDVVRVDA